MVGEKLHLWTRDMFVISKVRIMFRAQVNFSIEEALVDYWLCLKLIVG